jgi:hypothetical protein
MPGASVNEGLRLIASFLVFPSTGYAPVSELSGRVLLVGLLGGLPRHVHRVSADLHPQITWARLSEPHAGAVGE